MDNKVQFSSQDFADLQAALGTVQYVAAQPKLRSKAAYLRNMLIKMFDEGFDDNQLHKFFTNVDYLISDLKEGHEYLLHQVLNDSVEVF